MKRRTLVIGTGGMLLAGGTRFALGDSRSPITRPIPSSGENLPVMGMGSSRTFDVPTNENNLATLGEVMSRFIAGGGSLVDTSPMYGAAEAVLGEVISLLPEQPALFAATKVWADGEEEGIRQMRNSSKLMRTPVFDLMQIHNLRDWKVHLRTLKRWKEEGKIRYLGITTSHQRNHAGVEAIMKSEPLDFVQFSYNIIDRQAEQRLLPLAAGRGIATLINRPFQRGKLFDKVSGKPLPSLALELGCKSWAQFFLKFIIGHPAVTCLIPATAKVHHMEDNMGANFGIAPDAKVREEMLKLYQSL